MTFNTLKSVLAGIGNRHAAVKDYAVKSGRTAEKKIPEGFVSLKDDRKMILDGLLFKYVGTDGKLVEINPGFVKNGSLYECVENTFITTVNPEKRVITYENQGAKVEITIGDEIDDGDETVMEPEIPETGEEDDGRFPQLAVDPDIRPGKDFFDPIGGGNINIPGKPIVNPGLGGGGTSLMSLSTIPTQDNIVELSGGFGALTGKVRVNLRRLELAMMLDSLDDLDDDQSIVFHLKLTGCSARMDESGRVIHFENSDGKELFRMPMPKAIDACGYQIDSSKFSLEKTGEDTADITTSISLEWAKSHTTTLPITITPFIEVIGESMIDMFGYADSKTHEPVDDKFTVGMKSGQVYSLVTIIRSENVVSELERQDVRRFKANLNLHYEKQCDGEESQGFAVFVNDQEIMSDILADAEGSISVDLTDVIKEQLLNRMDGREVKDIEVAIYYDGRDPQTSYFPDGQIVDSGKDCIEIYGTFAVDASVRPSIEFEFVDDGKYADGMPELKRECGRSGTTYINLFDRSTFHVIDECSVSMNRLKLPISHRFDSALINGMAEKPPVGFGKGWMLSACQRLIKSASYDKVLGSKSVVYIDANNQRHELEERWYYTEDNTRHYVDKADVYIGNDQKLKYRRSNDSKIFDVEYEASDETGLTFVDGSSNAGYVAKSDLKPIRRFFLLLGSNTRRELRVKDGMLEIPHFWSENNNRKIEDGDIPVLTGYIPKGVNLYKRTYLDPTLIMWNGSSCTMYGDATEVVYSDTFLRPFRLQKDSEGNDIVIVSAYKYGIFKDNEEKPILSTMFGTRALQVEVETTYEQSKSDSGSIDYHVTEDIAKVDQQIKAVEDAIKQTVAQRKNLLSSLKNGTLQLESARMAQLGQMVMREKTVLVLDESEASQANRDQSDYSLKLQDDSIADNIEMLEAQIASLRSQLTILNETSSDYNLRLANLKEQKEALVEESKKNPTDYILDREGNFLGFDYAGRLVVVRDNLENEIALKYDENRLTDIVSDTQQVKLQYDGDDRLESMTDTAGQRWLYSYDSDGRLISVKTTAEHGKISEIKFTYDGDDNLVSVEDPTSLKTTISYSSNHEVTSLKQITNAKTISKDGIVKSDSPITVCDYTIKYDEELSQVTDNLTGGTSEIRCEFSGRTILKKDILDGKTVLECKAYDGEKEKMDVTFEEKDLVKRLPLPAKTEGFSESFTFDIVDSNPSDSQILRSSIRPDRIAVLALPLTREHITNPSFFTIALKVRLLDVDGNQVGEDFEVSYDGTEESDIAIAFRPEDWSAVKKIEFTYDAGLSQVDVASMNLSLYMAEGRFISYDDDRPVWVYTDKGIAHCLDHQDDKPTRLEMTAWHGQKKYALYRYDSRGRTVFARNADGMCEEKSFDKDGNLIETRTYPEGDPTLCTVSRYRYDEHGNRSEVEGELRDADGNYPVLKETYSEKTGRKMRETLPSGQTLAYGYDQDTGALLSVTSDAGGLGNTTIMGYEQGLLTSLSHHGFSFHYTYDGKGRRTCIGVADVSDYLSVSYTDDYADSTLGVTHGTKTISTFANGYSVASIKDVRGRIVSLKSEDHDISFAYDDDDNLTSKTDSTTGEYQRATYDDDGNILTKETGVSASSTLKTTVSYDARKRISSSALEIAGVGKVEETYSYNDDDDSIDSVTCSKDGANLFGITIEKDLLNRTVSTYIQLDSGTLLHEETDYLRQDDHATDHVKIKSIEAGGSEVFRQELSYDVLGRATSVETTKGTIRYRYDRLGRISREDNPILGKTFLWSYDAAGNVRWRKECAYTTANNPTGTTDISYSYAGSGWKDRLMTYGDQKFEYDLMGRPTLYRGMTAEWNGNGTLKSFNGTTFTYDMDGVRKTCSREGSNTEFTYDGTRIIRKMSADHDIIFRYANRTLIGLCIDGAEYLYAKDARGSIAALVDKNGKTVARYAYDAWGCHKVYDADWNENADPSFIGNINPIRYKSYLYDSDLGLYYLITRYYDPEIGRFISPDTLKVLDEDYARINGLNLYAYCGNDPVNNEDPEGEFFLFTLLCVALFGAAAGLAGQAISDVVTNIGNNGFNFKKWQWSPWQTYVGAAFGGAFNSALALFTSGASLQFSGVITGFASSLMTEFFNSISGNGFDFANVFLSSAGGALSDTIGGFIGNLPFVDKTFSSNLTGTYQFLRNLPKGFGKDYFSGLAKGMGNLFKWNFLASTQMSAIVSTISSNVAEWFSLTFPKWGIA